MTDAESAATARREVALRFALLGLVNTIDVLGSGGSRAQVAAGQGAFWAAAIDEQLQSRPWYVGRRDKDDDGRVLPGLRLARDGVTHGAVVVSRTAGLVYPLFADGGALSFGPDIWKSLDELLQDWTPEARSQKRMALVEHQKAVYEAAVSHRPIAEPLERAASWFRRLQDVGWHP